jgi:hypothetical protein
MRCNRCAKGKLLKAQHSGIDSAEAGRQGVQDGQNLPGARRISLACKEKTPGASRGFLSRPFGAY